MGVGFFSFNNIEYIYGHSIEFGLLNCNFFRLFFQVPMHQKRQHELWYFFPINRDHNLQFQSGETEPDDKSKNNTILWTLVLGAK